MKIICLSGCAGHGKDTAAQFLKDKLESKEKTVLVTHYADLLKYICKAFFGWNGEKDEAGRTLLQHVGTDIIRLKRPNFWVKFLADLFELFDEQWDFVIIADCRFPNELTYLQDRGFDVIHARVLRQNFDSNLSKEQKKHASETALDDVTPDVWLLNETIEQFHHEVDALAYDLMLEVRDEQNCDGGYVQMSIFDEVPRAEGA